MHCEISKEVLIVQANGFAQLWLVFICLAKKHFTSSNSSKNVRNTLQQRNHFAWLCISNPERLI